jgi:hypothetical protein
MAAFGRVIGIQFRVLSDFHFWITSPPVSDGDHSYLPCELLERDDSHLYVVRSTNLQLIKLLARWFN